MSLQRIVFVLGGPGSGKGTCCELLAQREPEKILHLSAGELLRRSCQRDPQGFVAQSLAQGRVVPSHITVGLLRDSIQEAPRSLVLIDGFPRTTENREGFLKAWERDADGVLLLDAPRDVLVQRLMSRRRSDDSEAAIQRRIETFELETKPITQLYEQARRLLVVNSHQSVEQVYEDARQALLQHRLLE